MTKVTSRVDEDRHTSFAAMYAVKLREAVERHPDEYSFPTTQAAAVAEKMTRALGCGTANKDSAAIRSTCRALGVKYTYTAIREYLTGTNGAKEQKDFCVQNHGSIFLLIPNTEAAKEWINAHIPEDAPTIGPNIAVEHRYIGDIVDGIVKDGLTVE